MAFQRTSTTLVWNSRERETYRAVGYVLTGILLLGIYAGLKHSRVPATRIDTTHYEEIDWARFTPTPPPKADTPEESTVEPTPVKEPPPVALRRLERVNLRDIVIDFERISEQPTPTVRSPLKAADLVPRTAPVRADLDLSELSSLQMSSGAPEVAPFRVPLKAPAVSGPPQEGLELKVGRGSELRLEEVEYGVGEGRIDARPPVGAKGEVPSIPMIAADSLTGDPNLYSLFDELVRWMKGHPAEFSPVVKAFLEYRAGDLTAKATFRIDGRNFELYLLCREKEHEVRIGLVEGQSSILLIDRGFRERSNYLRIGRVARNPSGQIAAFETSQESPSDRRTAEFYQIFMSWWKTQKDE